MASLTIRGLRAKVIDLSRLSVVMEAVGSSSRMSGLINMPGRESNPGRRLIFCFDLTLNITIIIVVHVSANRGLAVSTFLGPQMGLDPTS